MSSDDQFCVKPIKVHDRKKNDEQEEEVLEPVSPTGHYYNSSVLSVSNIAVFEMENPMPIHMTDPKLSSTMIKNIFLPISSRFNSVMVEDEHGAKYWKKVDVKVEEHIKTPVFQNGLSMESYDEFFQDYLTQVTLEQIPKNKPMWEIHVFNYPTSNAPGTVIFKLHHALGDGYSLMGALFTCLQRADDPSLPLTFPMSTQKSKNNKQKPSSVLGQMGGAVWKNLSAIANIPSALLNTATDFTWSLLSNSILRDHLSPIMSGNPRMECKPVVLTTVTFSLDKIKQIKHKLGGTVNDITAGIIFYGIRLYMEAVSKGSSNSRSTALVLLNTRMMGSYNYRTVEEMKKTDSKSPWGNHFGYLQIAIPESMDASTADPLNFVRNSKKTIQKKKNSLCVYLTGHLLELMSKYRGYEKTSEYIYDVLSNTSTVLSSMLGPMEKMSLANEPVKGFYFMSTNVPLDTIITIASYMGQLRVCVSAQKETINHKLFNKSLEMAYDKIFEAAIVKS